MVCFDLIGCKPSHRLDEHRAVGRQHSRPRPMSATGGLAKAVVQIALIEWRYRLDRALCLVDPEERDLGRGRDSGEANRDSVTSRREDHQTVDRTASAPKLVEPCESGRKRRVYVWLQLALVHTDTGQSLPPISNHQARVHSGKMAAVVASGNSFFDSNPGQVGFDHRRQLARKFLTGLRRLPNARALAQGERASFEPHLLRALDYQSFRGDLA